MERGCIITGGGSGIGKAVAILLTKIGFSVIINGRREARLKEVCNEALLINPLAKIDYVCGDINNSNTIEELFKKCETKFNLKVSVFLVNAGRGLPGTINTSDSTQWKELFNINCIAALSQMKAASTYMLEQVMSAKEQIWDIVVIGSSIGRNVSPFNPVYGATKFAINSLAEALRLEVGKKGIRVSLIEPGIVESDFQKTAKYDVNWFESYKSEIGPLLEPKDIANLINFIINQPSHVHINDVLIRPTKQGYP